MFTDGPVTPLHVESLIAFLRSQPSRKFTRDDLRNSFQPSSITGSQTQSNDAIKASIDLGLVHEGSNKTVTLTANAKGKKTIALALKSALDENVLGNIEIEDYLALFYSYMLGLDEAALGKSREDWVLGFNRDVFDGKSQTNQFNKTKLTGLHRWFSYMGLGWYDQSGQFNCNPYERVARNLKAIFGKGKILDCDEFLDRLRNACPELDGGEIFLQANKRYDSGAKNCTLGLSHALVDLHLDGAIQLHCPKDSDGWSIAKAGPPNDGKTLVSNRISQVQIGGKK